MSQTRALIFDLGGVLLNLDQDRTLRAFKRLGVDLARIDLELPVFQAFETGHLTEAAFRTAVGAYLPEPVSGDRFDQAWNAMLLDVPAERFTMLERLRKQFRIYLLSNTNAIHIRSFRESLEQAGNLQRWDALFDHQFYSYEVGLRKPETLIYAHVARQTGIPAAQCLFLDDSRANTEGAVKAGMRAHWLRAPLSYLTLDEIRPLL